MLNEIKMFFRLVNANQNGSCNMSVDEAEYIAKYLEAHPGKKCDWFLLKKLRTQYFLKGLKHEQSD